MNKREPLYEGKAKILYEGPEPGTLIQYFKDDTTAFNNEKHEVISGKGVLNNRISEYIFTSLEEIGIPTHFIKTLNMREQLIKAVEIIPIEVVVRNMTAGSLAKRFDVEEGLMLPVPVTEFYLKSDKLGDPMLLEEHITSFGWAEQEELDEIKGYARRINDFLSGLFMGAKLKLIDFKLEFGRIYDEDGLSYIILADEISPDSCRLWDAESGEKLDKDRFRHDLGGVLDAYQEVAKRLGIAPANLEVVEQEGKEKPKTAKVETLVPKGKKKPAAKKKTTPKKKDDE